MDLSRRKQVTDDHVTTILFIIFVLSSQFVHQNKNLDLFVVSVGKRERKVDLSRKQLVTGNHVATIHLLFLL